MKRSFRQWWDNEAGPWVIFGIMIALWSIRFVLSLPQQAYYKMLDMREKRKKATLVA